MCKKIAALIGLLIVGFVGAAIVWALVILPGRIVQPLEFTPLVIDAGTEVILKQKIEEFQSNRRTSINLSREELGLLLKSGLEEQMGIDITDISVEFNNNIVTVLVKVRISDIPSTGYLSWILSRSHVEYTTTLVSALLWPEDGKVSYTVLDFRIGNFKIPPLIVRKLIGEGARSIEGIYIRSIEYHEDFISVARE